ncbi:MAG: prepilin-type N-terminal cleavage/methylation domain-containing protein [Candidatus Omnitrophica bacterium]|nr:prepilin-type N-terminal cleavage/methylation domain-containing protein [Candidatus Omnitrophota bacterium]MDD5429956.1 prepilin-type N-terminal cleavage/methylation domain-containing protein [Candidatus Omnitrophota bacterium]
MKSFTLIELIVVIAIVAVLAAIIAPNAFKAIEKAKIATAISDFKTYKTSMGALYADTGHWIADSFGPNRRAQGLYPGATNLDTNISNWPGWDGPYLEKVKLSTPWGGIYTIERWNDFGRGSRKEMWLGYDDLCYSGGLSNCYIPLKSAQKMDERIDDGDLSTGSFRHGLYTSESSGDCAWILVWDYTNWEPPD